MNGSRQLVLVTLVLVVLANAGAGGCASDRLGGAVSLLGPWTGAEEDQFRQALRVFSARTGTQVDYQGTRALGQVLLNDVQQGTPHDVAVLPSPGELARYAAEHAVLPLDDVVGPEWESEYSPQWRKLARAGQDGLYAVPIQVNLKSIVWFNPRRLPGDRPATWADLTALTGAVVARGDTPWCMGMGASATSGWPGTDWIEDILLRQAGTEVYQRWVAGTLPWTDARVRRAWQTWGEITGGPGQVRGGAESALLTDFADAARAMFTDPPGCFLEHQGSFIAGAYRGYPGGPRAGTDFDFFPLPRLGPVAAGASQSWEVSADMAGMFRDTPQARALVRFLASADGQRIWPGVGAFSANTRVGRQAYGDEVSRRVIDELTGSDTLCFDASDLMPATLRNAFYRAVLTYLSDQSRLDELLGELDQIRRELADRPGDEPWLTVSCAP
ncbi:ABC transporter substrate-binding protein [Goodfellowiella coeruleoviolacea]|uniref:Alpha-glucoside transport system substrate-binding protein n=1 Tax=Goodfellowiella coeruleoviolacea TaxID=334858 RepID=A0AAE3G9U1_9PSEU|nr:ABC transporter substrate-binding protein [Goodfellowiella coeruleoviolacea]MCP2164312.1 alpha-glucoside transport system substrate-binding protein [Goodfellowiella coeruleoviolacea]